MSQYRVPYAACAPPLRHIACRVSDYDRYPVQCVSGSVCAGVDVGRLNNILMQLRKNCNHPDLITSEWEESSMFPSADVLVEQCGKMQVLDRLLTRLHKAGHKVLIFSQVSILQCCCVCLYPSQFP